jgi:two-component system, NtrC family, nitrogen regulation sensor histidine kinase NtrY
MNNISLKTQTHILVVLLILLATVPLIMYYVYATEAISRFGTDPQIESSLNRSIELAAPGAAKEEAAAALKKYGQFRVLKDRIMRQLIVFSIVYSIAVVAIALVLGGVLVSRITRPLRNLTEATHHLGHEELDYHLDERAGGEVGVLVKAFNAMTADLKIARQQRTIAERRATWQHVARTIAHEIKNPLTPIRLSTERLYEKFLSQSADFAEVMKSTTSTILVEIGNLQKLIDTFHRYAKFPDPVLRPESLAAVARETVSLFSASKVPISSDIDERAAAPLSIDKAQVREALSNLIKNAIEAIEASGRSDGAVAVRCAYSDGGWEVSVCDNGCGISPDNQKKLFQPYFTTKKHGNGIGLALTERIITLNGGRIRFDSREGEGTTFTILFPREGAHAYGEDTGRG